MKYYISSHGSDLASGMSENEAWKTIEKSNSTVCAGDEVLFCSGETFFGTIVPPTPQEGKTTVYSSYGEGKRPVISEYKYPHADSWEDCGDNVWRLDLNDVTTYDGNTLNINANVGFLRLDGKIMPRKKFVNAGYERDYDFYSDGERYLYVYCSDNPSFGGELAVACRINGALFRDNVVFENLYFTGAGAHGISGTVHNAVVRGCGFHEIGGSILVGYGDGITRYGNGVECWSDSSDVLIEKCDFSVIYDVAFTMQGNEVTNGWRNISFRDNRIWNCQQSFEIWSDGDLPETGFVNCRFENNVCLDAGYCWSYDVRPNKDCAAHLLLYGLKCPLCDVTITGNVFAYARTGILYKSGGVGMVPSDYKIFGNTIIYDKDIGVHSEWNTEYEKFVRMMYNENEVHRCAYHVPELRN